jgi:hypothetical protein
VQRDLAEAGGAGGEEEKIINEVNEFGALHMASPA